MSDEVYYDTETVLQMAEKITMLQKEKKRLTQEVEGLHSYGNQVSYENTLLKAENKQLREKAKKYDEVEFLVIDIKGNPNDIIHLHTLLGQKNKLEDIRKRAEEMSQWDRGTYTHSQVWREAEKILDIIHDGSTPCKKEEDDKENAS